MQTHSWTTETLILISCGFWLLPVFSGCETSTRDPLDGDVRDTVVRDRSGANDSQRSADITATNPELDAKNHPGASVILEFVADVQAGKYEEEPITFFVDFELTEQGRLLAFRLLEDYIQSQSWEPGVIAVWVINNVDDSVDIYLKGDQGGLMYISAGYHYRTDEWKLDAYEIPDRSFARPEGQTYEQYMRASMADIRNQAQPYSRTANELTATSEPYASGNQTRDDNATRTDSVYLLQ